MVLHPLPTFDSSCIIRLVCTLHSGRWYPVAPMKHQIDFIVFKQIRFDHFKWSGRSRQSLRPTPRSVSGRKRFHHDCWDRRRAVVWKHFKIAVKIAISNLKMRGSKFGWIEEKKIQSTLHLPSCHPPLVHPTRATHASRVPAETTGWSVAYTSESLFKVHFLPFIFCGSISNFIHSCPLSSLLPTEL